MRGPTCNIKGEILPFTMDLPKNIADGDLVVVTDVGAYNVMQQSSFNGYEPEIQFIANGFPELDKKSLPKIHNMLAAWTIAAASILGFGYSAFNNAENTKKIEQERIQFHQNTDRMVDEMGILYYMSKGMHSSGHSFEGDSIMKEKAQRYKWGLYKYEPPRDTLNL